ncbi:hypothetical protein DRN73_07510 [Candidatus Pacearchaeota archaeon]|nr:MAG: hypothetical protein DRN73_07510 [Candidatus Pacearchaeota archaeon]
MAKTIKETIKDEILIEKLKNTLQVFWEKNISADENIQSICKKVAKFNNINVSNYETFETLKQEIFKELNKLFLEKLFYLWIDKCKKLTKRKINSKEKEDTFNELISLCSEIYACLVNIICEIFPSSIKIEDIKIQSDVLDISNIFCIIEALQQEQDFAFDIETFKRDNIIHQFRVFLLGVYFLSQTNFWRNLIWEDLKSFFPQIQQELKSLDNDEKSKFKLIWAIWGLAALFHDCGRVVQTFYENLRQIQAHFEKLLYIFNFPLPKLNTKVELNPYWKQKKNDFLKLLEYFFCVPGSKWYNYYEEVKNVIETSLQIPDHGIISALLIIYSNIENLIRKLGLDKLDKLEPMSDDFEEDFLKTTNQIKILKEPKSLIKNAFPIFLVFYPALAIALHNQKKYWFITALSTLLILCDNLQEWERLTKIGDQVIKIFPCNEVLISITENNSKEIIIKATVPYQPPSTSIEKTIFSRFDPEKIWNEFEEEISSYKSYKSTMFNELTKNRGKFKAIITIHWTEKIKKTEKIEKTKKVSINWGK